MQAAFDSMDARASALAGLWPGPEMTSQELREHMNIITDHLACDTYGGLQRQDRSVCPNIDNSTV